jgi:hypothetical protein
MAQLDKVNPMIFSLIAANGFIKFRSAAGAAREVSAFG